jgi:uncharacterized BrkB/YihY/UPF0761 family membrane protein
MSVRAGDVLRQSNEGEQMFKMFRLIPETDDLLENAWRTRNWPTFIRTWLVSSVAMVVVTFVMTFIMLYVPFLVYNVVVSIVAALFGGGAHLVGPSLGEVFSTLAALSAVMVGLVTLIFTVPVMLLKQLSGQFK